MPLVKGQRVLHKAHGWGTVHSAEADGSYTLVCQNNAVIAAREDEVSIPLVPPPIRPVAEENAATAPVPKRARNKAHSAPEV